MPLHVTTSTVTTGRNVAGSIGTGISAKVVQKLCIANRSNAQVKRA